MMNDNIEGHDREVTLPPEQLSDWYKKLKKMENSLILIMMKRRQFKKITFTQKNMILHVARLQW